MTPNNREELVELMARAMGLEEPNEFWCDTARAALTALDTAGIALVPRVATDKMALSGAETMPDYDPGCDDAERCYAAMLSASPYISSALPHLTKRPEQHGGGDD